MFHPDSKISVLDVSSGEYNDISLSKLFEKYSSQVIKFSEYMSSIIFDRKIYIRHMEGFTELTRINKFRNDRIRWKVLEGASRHEFGISRDIEGIVCAEQTIFPVYDSKLISQPYNGIGKYNTQDKLIIDINPTTDAVRCYSSDAEQEFFSPKIYDFVPLDREHPCSYNLDTKDGYACIDGYEVRTMRRIDCDIAYSC